MWHKIDWIQDLPKHKHNESSQLISLVTTSSDDCEAYRRASEYVWLWLQQELDVLSLSTSTSSFTCWSLGPPPVECTNEKEPTTDPVKLTYTTLTYGRAVHPQMPLMYIRITPCETLFASFEMNSSASTKKWRCFPHLDKTHLLLRAWCSWTLT